MNTTKMDKKKWVEENKELFNKSKKDLQVFLIVSMSFCAIAIGISAYYLVKTLMS